MLPNKRDEVTIMVSEKTARWSTWDQIVPSQEWEDLGEFTVNGDWDSDVTASIQDDRSWDGGDRAVVHPGILAQKVFKELSQHFSIAQPPGQTGLHAREYLRLYGVTRQGEHLKLKGRVPLKFIKRNQKYIFVEAWLLAPDGVPRLFHRQTRICEYRPNGK